MICSIWGDSLALVNSKYTKITMETEKNVTRALSESIVAESRSM